MKQMSMNNNIICKHVQTTKEVKSVTSNGFTFVQQHQNLIALEVAMDAKLSNGDMIAKGSLVFLREDYYQTSKKTPFTLPLYEGNLVIVNINEVILVEIARGQD